MLKEEQRKAFNELDNLLLEGHFEDAVKKMRSWNKIWLNEFYQTYPPPSNPHYNLLKSDSFQSFWAEQRGALKRPHAPEFAFTAQPNIPDVDFVLGYVFYLLAVHPKTSTASREIYLIEAEKLNSIHAAQEKLHTLLQSKALESEDQEDKITSIDTFLRKKTASLAKHGTPGYLLLANGYLHIVKLTLDQKPSINIERYERACELLWKNLILAQEVEMQSTASINNAYFGEGLRLSNPMFLTSIEEIKTLAASRLITDSAIKLRAEKTVREERSDKEDYAHLIAWRQAKERRSRPAAEKAPREDAPSPDSP